MGDVSPHLFLLGFVFGEVSKLNVTFVRFLCEHFFMLDVTHGHVDVETESGLVSLIPDIFIDFYFKNYF